MVQYVELLFLGFAVLDGHLEFQGVSVQRAVILRIPIECGIASDAPFPIVFGDSLRVVGKYRHIQEPNRLKRRVGG